MERSDIDIAVSGLIISISLPQWQISDDTWMEMLKVRNELAHDYDGDIVRAYCNVIVEKYIDLFFDFELVVKKLFEFKYAGGEL